MKIRIEVEPETPEEEIVIHCREISSDIQKIQQFILQQSSSLPKVAFYKNQEEYYFTVDEVLFFETSADKVYAHTADDTFSVKYRLYELEDFLPHYFVRISKSSIVNIRHIYSIQRNLTSASLIRFHKSHKQVYVSRSYYKLLKCKLDERS